MTQTALLLLGLGLLAAGCAGGPGTFCISDGECRTGLRCAVSSGSRGVCTYPPTAAADAAPGDGRRADRAGGEPTRRDSQVRKLGPEAGLADAGQDAGSVASDAWRADLPLTSDLAVER